MPPAQIPHMQLSPGQKQKTRKKPQQKSAFKAKKTRSESEKNLPLAKSQSFWHILIPRPLTPALYTYRSTFPLTKGQVVHVPWGTKSLWGIAWSQTNETSCPKQLQLKNTIQRSHLMLSETLCTFVQKAAAYTMNPLGSMMKMTIPCPDALESIPTENAAHTTTAKPQRANLSDAQQKALEDLYAQCTRQKGTYAPCLLEGLTGSGKTEVYLAWLRRHLGEQAAEKTTQSLPSQAEARPMQEQVSPPQALVLLPEISLTPQWCARFEKRFGFAPILWHSHLTPKQRRIAYTSIITGQARVIAGARSALFLPYQNLAAIIVDEEHDLSFKQEDSPRYHARDMAVLRAHSEKIPILLVSATPSLESLHNVRMRKYTHVRLAQRYKSTLPRLKAIPKPDKGWLANALIEKLQQTLQRGGQSLVFLNRRGYAPFVACTSCHQPAQCPHCAVGMVFHKKTDQLICHACDLHTPPVCKNCGDQTRLSMAGLGIEKLEETLGQHLPESRLHTLSSDGMTPRRLAATIEQLEKHQIDILIGTQMVAKGHHFPGLQFVAVLEVDHTLNHFDFRAHERFFQLMTQVSGRAGRAEKPGEVWIQTVQASHPLLQAVLTSDYHTWALKTLEQRAEAALPPHGRMATLTLVGANEAQVKAYAARCAAHLPDVPDSMHVMGPAPAPLPFVRRRYRYRFLIHRSSPTPLQPFLKTWLTQIQNHRPPPFSVRLNLDIDPYDFL